MNFNIWIKWRFVKIRYCHQLAQMLSLILVFLVKLKLGEEAEKREANTGPRVKMANKI